MYKYETVLRYLESMIETGKIKEGEKLPSIRFLVNQYDCNKATIIRALHELERKHMIYSVPKSGYYVVKKDKLPNDTSSQWIDFVTSAPDPDVFPYLDFQRCINKAIDTYKNDLFIYGTPKGLPSLISVLQRQLANYQIFVREEDIFITSGVQQALVILTSIPFPNGNETILIEQPSYHLFIEYLETNGVPVCGITRTTEGIDLNELEQIFKNEKIKFFYTIPRFHHPLGTSYLKKEKETIASLAKKYNVFIVEDDYLADLEQNSKEDPIYNYDNREYVIYVKSYSKIIFPGLRIGVAVIPPSIAAVFHKYKKLLDIDSSMISQAALEIYIKSGMFDRHKRKIRDSYFARTSRLSAALEKLSSVNEDLFTYTITTPLAVHTCLALDKSIPIRAFIQNAQQKNIVIESIDKHYLAYFPQEKWLKLNVSHVKEEQIEEGVRQLIETMKLTKNMQVYFKQE